MSLRPLIETWYRRVWDEADYSAIEELMAHDVEASGLSGLETVDPAGIRTFVEMLHNLMGRIETTILHSVEDGEWISCVVQMRGHRADGKIADLSGQVMCRIVDGKIVRGINHADFVSFYEQLGLLPPHTQLRALSGERLTAGDPAGLSRGQISPRRDH